MGFGPSFYMLLFVGLLWLGPAWWDHRFLAGMLAWDVMAITLWWVDLTRLPRAQQISVSRSWNSPASFGNSAEIAVEVRTRAGAPIVGEVVDDVPAALRDAPASLRIQSAPGRAGLASYFLEPVERGDIPVGPVFLRLQSSLRLAERWVTADLGQTVRVYPNLEEARRQTLYLIRSRQVELEKRLKRRRGRGREFEILREYHQGDERRDICWTATARRGALVSKVHQIERSQAVWAVIDAGRLLRARVALPGMRAPIEKLDAAANAALTLAHVALYSGDRVGLVAYGRRLQARLNAARGAHQLRALAEALAQVKSEPYEGAHGLAAESLLRAQKRRGLVVWLTDLAETPAGPDVIESALRLSRRHLVLFVVMGQPDVDAVAAAKPESAEAMYQNVAALEMIQRRDILLRGLRQQGVMAMEVAPGQLSTTLVNSYLEIKERFLI